jgi:ATP-dependent phosphofructokinase / diphosphate-dependent phosphofructokinase
MLGGRAGARRSFVMWGGDEVRMRLGILTGGGDCPGLNAAIRAAAIRAVRTYEGLVLGFADGWRGMLRDQVRELDLRAVAGLLQRGGTMLGTSRVDPYREPGGVDAVRTAFTRHQLDGLIVCGGDGTLSAAARLAREGLPIVGIPKTIDNDIRGTDYAIGFDTAVTTVTQAVDALQSHAESHDRVIVVEVMGRSAGWIAASAGIAGGADVTVTPEACMSVEDVCDVLRARRLRGRDFSIVVVAEGVCFPPDATGRCLTPPERKDAFGRPVYGGVGDVLAREIEARTGVETRMVTLGYTQRGGTPTAFDRVLASRMGVAAVDLVAAGSFGRMVCLRGGRMDSVPLAGVLEGPRGADPELLEVAKVFFG